ncbi:MAG: Gfo/Idh/MocA family oxidoreductase [Candidatus Bathyarchaeota archaeon]|nr:MAG: Gfo/Idh/MocA family oxidoreductase [Candidatus Bathyarchaeota archaeon]
MEFKVEGQALDKLGVGFIGSGFVAGFHAEAFKGVRDAEITAVYNVREESARALTSKIDELGVGKPEVYTDLREMLSEGSVNAVWILNPNFVRLEVVEVIAEEAAQGRNDLVGVCCEKPLARTAEEAEKMVELVEKAGLLHGYLENQVFAPGVARGKEAVWRYGARYAGRPYLARAAEEHGGPHRNWFWDPRLSGGGVLLDMACHSLEADRYLLSDPDKPKEALKPVSVQSTIASLKWTREPYVSRLKADFGVDYGETPAEDYALTLVSYEDEDGGLVLSEARTSWSFIGPGLRLTFEVLGPEYSISINSLQQELNVFFSRGVVMPPSEEFVEKQAAEQGLMPMVPNEAIAYGYQDEDRHMVESFLRGEMPEEDWRDGLLVARLMMTAYKSAEEGSKLSFDPKALKGYKPKVASGDWRP